MGRDGHRVGERRYLQREGESVGQGEGEVEGGEGGAGWEKGRERNTCEYRADISDDNDEVGQRVKV